MRFLIKYLSMTFFVVVAAILYVLCFTSQGLVMDIRYITKFLPGQLQVGKIEGALVSGFTLQDVHYQNPDVNVALKSLTLHWFPKQLWKGKLAIDSLIIEQPQITLFTSNSTSSSSDFSLDDLQFLHRITMNNLVVHQLSLQKDNLRLELNGELQNQWNFYWKLAIPTLKTVCTDCSGSFNGSGSIIGERMIPTIKATIQGNKLNIDGQRIEKLTGDANIVLQAKANSTLHLTATQLKISDNPIKKIALAITSNMAFEKQTLLAQMQIALANKTAIAVNASFPKFSSFIDPKQKIMATIKVNMTDLSPIAYFVPVIQKPRGLIQGDINLTGLLSQPEITGKLNLTQGHVAIHDLGIRLNDILLQATLDKSNIISLQGTLRSAKGTGKVQGTVDLNKPLYPLNLTLQGNDLNVVHIPKFKIAASPDIKLSYTYPNLEIEGKILIPKATIKLKNYINTVSLPEETVFVGEAQPETSPILSAAKLHLAIQLGDNIYLDYKDFVTNLGGQLVIDQVPNSPPTATGEIYTIKGQYTIYGQNLVIKTGRLIYTGNLLTNPGLNVEAIRNVKNVNAGSSALDQSLESYAGTDTTVGVRVTGTAENPTVTLFSSPAGLSQAQILSSLGGGGAVLMSALSALNPGASKMDGMTSKFTKALGLSEVNISSVQTFNSTTNQMQSTPSFVVGKQISKKLSLHYSIGIFNPVSIFNVRYQLNKHWAIQSETSTIDNGADILYGFESS